MPHRFLPASLEMFSLGCQPPPKRPECADKTADQEVLASLVETLRAAEPAI